MKGAERNPYQAPSVTAPMAPAAGVRRWNLGQHFLFWSQVWLPFFLMGFSPWMVVRNPSGFPWHSGQMVAIVAVGAMIQAGLIRARNRQAPKGRRRGGGGWLFVIQFLVYIAFLILPILSAVLIDVGRYYRGGNTLIP